MDVCAGLVSEMCCGSLIVWMCIIHIIIEFVVGVRFMHMRICCMA